MKESVKFDLFFGDTPGNFSRQILSHIIYGSYCYCERISQGIENFLNFQF